MLTTMQQMIPGTPQVCFGKPRGDRRTPAYQDVCSTPEGDEDDPCRDMICLLESGIAEQEVDWYTPAGEHLCAWTTAFSQNAILQGVGSGHPRFTFDV